MFQPKIYADFHNLDDSNRLRLTCAGTKDDLDRRASTREGLVLTFYMDDADDQGEADELRTEGVVHYDEQRQPGSHPLIGRPFVTLRTRRG